MKLKTANELQNIYDKLYQMLKKEVSTHNIIDKIIKYY